MQRKAVLELRAFEMSEIPVSFADDYSVIPISARVLHS